MRTPLPGQLVPMSPKGPQCFVDWRWVKAGFVGWYSGETRIGVWEEAPSNTVAKPEGPFGIRLNVQQAKNVGPIMKRDKPWELYDMDADRTELNNLSEKNPEKVVELDNIYNGWADRCGVEPWQQIIGADALEFGMKLDGNFSMNGKHSHVVSL